MLLIAFGALSLLCFVPAAITRHRARVWLLCASVLLAGIAVQSFQRSSVLHRPTITVSGNQIVIHAGKQRADLPLDAPVWTGIHRNPPAGVLAGVQDRASGWRADATGHRYFVATWSDPALLVTTAGFDLVLDWDAVVDLEQCVDQMQAARHYSDVMGGSSAVW